MAPFVSFLLLSLLTHCPLIGVKPLKNPLESIMSKNNTLMFLGFQPILTINTVCQVFHVQKKDWHVWVFTLFETLIFILFGVFGPLSFQRGLFVGIQIIGTTLFCFYLPQKNMSPFQLYFIGNTSTSFLQSIWYHPSLLRFILTVVLFVSLCFLFTLHQPIFVQSRKQQGNRHKNKYPLRLFYTNTTPIFLYQINNTNFYALKKALVYLFPILPLDTLEYFVTFPPSPFHLIRLFTSVTTTMVLCVFYARSWTKINHTTGADLAKGWKKKGIFIPGHRHRAIQPILEKSIDQANLLSGTILAVVLCFSHFMHPYLTATEMILLLTTFQAYRKSIE